jgi:predicted molibdopterin-dependent oxidoreductase YjgC
VAEIGTILGGRYRLVELLGQGGMATIFRGTDTRLNRQVAIKVLPSSVALDEEGGLQWPCPTADHPGTPFLFKNGFPRGKATFSMVHYTPSVERPDAEYPFTLTTGRMLFQYHGGSMTRRVAPIEQVAGEPYIEINPEDARVLAITNGTPVTVASRQGSLTVKAQVSSRPGRGVVFIPFHFREAAANVLTSSKGLDPICRIPSFKVTAVRIEKT